MKIALFKKVTLITLAAGLVALAAPRAHAQAQAAPGPVFSPSFTQSSLDSLKAGDQIQVKCAQCNSVSTLTIDKDKSAPAEYKCAKCGAVFHLRKRHGKYVMVDKNGHIAEVAMPSH